VLVASPAYLKRRGAPATVEALARHDTLNHAVDLADTWALVSEGRAARAVIRSVFRSNGGTVILDLALGGAGVALLPDWFVAEHVRARRLCRVLPAWSTEPATVHALHRTVHRGELRVRTLIDHLRAAWASYPRP
jgi:DNA-binding transcriptional LysR family regulator